MRRVLPLGLSRCGGAGGFRTRTNKVHSIECFVRDEVRTEHRSTEVEQPGEESKGGGPQAPSFGLQGGELSERVWAFRNVPVARFSPNSIKTFLKPEIEIPPL